MLVLCTLVHFKEKQQILILISTNHIICSLKPTSTIIDNEDKFVTLLLKQQEPLMGFKLTTETVYNSVALPTAPCCQFLS